jgi:plastocyanin
MSLPPSHIRRIAALAPVLFLLALAGCGSSGGGSTSGGESTASSGAGESAGSAGTKAVNIADFAFHPGTIKVPKGTTIVFTNEDETAHTATAKGSEAFDTEAIQPGKSAEVTLEESGTYDYYCAFHPFMKGVIEVE